MAVRRLGIPLLLLISFACTWTCSSPASAHDDHEASSAARREAAVPYTVTLPGTSVSFEMVPVQPGPGGREGFYMSATEIPWEVFDVYMYGLDVEESTAEQDAVTRPSRPYIPPDRGFGHAGHPAISLTFKNAQAFCAWLTRKTGREYRLPTEEEWVHACRAGRNDPPEKLDEVAWYWDNTEDMTKPVGKKKPNAFGLHDMLGNVAEWCVGRDGEPVALGGSYLDEAEDVACTARQKQTPAWNASDPQIPKSTWWLSDCSWVGFRVVSPLRTNNP